MAAALSPLAETPSPTPLDLLLTTLAMAAVVWLLLDLIERRRFARPRVRLLPPTAGARLALATAFLRHGARERTVAVGLRAPAQARRRRHQPGSAALFAAPGQRRTHRRRVCAGAAARGGHLGRRGRHSPSRIAPARAARSVVARLHRGRLAGGGRDRVRSDPRRRLRGAAGAAVDRDAGLGSVRARTGACERAHAPHLADRAAGRLLPRTARSGAGHVPVAAGARDRVEGTADRDHVRAAGGEPARGSAAAAAAGGRADRRDSGARRTGTARRLDAGRRSRARLCRLVAHRSRDLSPDVGGRGLQRGRPAGQRVQAQPARVRDHRIPLAGMQLGRTVRRGLAVRIQRTPRAPHRARRLRTRPDGRQHRRARDARLPDAAVHLVAESVPGIAAPQSSGGARRRFRPRRRVHRLRLEPRADLRVGHAGLDAAGPGLPAAGGVANAVLGHARSRRPDVPRVLPERSRRHLRARLSGHQLDRPPDQPRGAGDARPGAVSSPPGGR